MSLKWNKFIDKFPEVGSFIVLTTGLGSEIEFGVWRAGSPSPEYDYFDFCDCHSGLGQINFELSNCYWMLKEDMVKSAIST